MMNTLFTNASIIMPGGSVRRGCLGVCGNTIAFVGEQPPELDFSAQRIVDCAGNLLMPGLVNAHTHLPMTLMRSIADDVELQTWLNKHVFPIEARLTGDIARTGTQLAMAELLRGGVTAVNDMYFFCEEIAEEVAAGGLRAMLSHGIVSSDDDGASDIETSVSFFRRWHGTENGRIQVALAPHAEYTCNEKTLRAIAEQADKLGCRIHIHVSESFAEHEQCKMRHDGKTPTQFLESLGLITSQTMMAHCVHVELEDVALIAARKANILHCPQSNLKLGSGIAPLPLFLTQKINVALGTDGAASNNNLDMWEEVRLAATLHKGITNNPTVINARQALHMGTASGAKTLGLSAGALTAGALADIIMVDTYAPHMTPHSDLLGNVIFSAQNADVLLTMVDGRILYERGEYYTLDVARIVADAQKCYEQLTRS